MQWHWLQRHAVLASGDDFWPLTLANNAVQKMTGCAARATDKSAADALLIHTQPLNDCNHAFTTSKKQIHW